MLRLLETIRSRQADPMAVLSPSLTQEGSMVPRDRA